MKFLLVFLLCIPLVSAYSVGVSPEKITLDEFNRGDLTLVNPNAFDVRYTLSGVLKDSGKLPAHSMEKISFTASKGSLVISFQGKGDISLRPSFMLDVMEHPKQKQRNWKVLILFGIITLITLFALRKLSLSYFSISQNKTF